MIEKMMKRSGFGLVYNWKEIAQVTDESFVQAIHDNAMKGRVSQVQFGEKEETMKFVYFKIGQTWHSFTWDEESCRLLFAVQDRKTQVWKLCGEYRNLAAYRERRKQTLTLSTEKVLSRGRALLKAAGREAEEVDVAKSGVVGHQEESGTY
jgi:hypothetical protein